jgi:NADH:ubiquinone oxidoreductase subunit C
LLPDATVVKHILDSAGIEHEVEETTLGLIARLAPSDVSRALAVLRDSELGFRMLLDLLGTDTSEDVELTYHLRSFTRDEELYVKVHVPYDGTVESVWNTYPSALLPERETAEMFGLSLAGHPTPKRLFTTEGVEPLLRKSVPIRTAEEVRER